MTSYSALSCLSSSALLPPSRCCSRGLRWSDTGPAPDPDCPQWTATSPPPLHLRRAFLPTRSVTLCSSALRLARETSGRWSSGDRWWRKREEDFGLDMRKLYIGPCLGSMLLCLLLTSRLCLHGVHILFSTVSSWEDIVTDNLRVEPLKASYDRYP